MHESVWLILTEQLEQVFVSITAMLATAWYISSLADAGFNMKTRLSFSSWRMVSFGCADSATGQFPVC